MIDFRLQRYAFAALASAALFGVSTPLAKLLLGEVSPVVLAALLYLGSGLGLGLVLLVRRAAKPVEAALSRRDLPWLAGAVVAGGVAAPVVLLWGLRRTLASDAALLLNFETVLTALLAAVIFREAVGRRVWTAAAVMFAAGVLLAYDPAARLAISPHAAAIVLACALWALDNNLTRKISGADPMQIAAIKGLVAGTVNLALGLGTGAALPAAATIAAGTALGFASYGVSLVLFIHALRHLGAARTGAHFGTAPFIGAAVAVPLLGEPVTGALLLATALMAIATWLVLTERHEHEHAHERIVHTHRHAHDVHHRHVHAGDEGPEPHTHEHVHEPMRHSHPHLPDLHHRHEH
ncbi:MAG TPA: DMT family transporter [Burkholderiales bacterium]|nr:DMT family transporter [Burkholderiales bacterium]